MAEEKKDSKLVFDKNTGLFSFEKETMTVEEFNQLALEVMQQYASQLKASVEQAMILEREACAKIADDNNSATIASAIRNRIPNQSLLEH